MRFAVFTLLLLLAPNLLADELTPAQRREKADHAAQLAINLAGIALEKSEFIDAVQMADLADKCAQASGDDKMVTDTFLRTNAIRAKCPPAKIEEARKIVQELIAGADQKPAIIPDNPDRKRTTEFKIENNTLILPAPVAFEPNTATLTKESQDALYVVVDFLAAKPLITTLRIEAHTTPDLKDPQAQSNRRAQAVASWLITHGVDPKRLIAVGFGAGKPLAQSDTPENKSANQRIEFHPAALRGKPIGGQPLDGGGQVVK